VLLKRIWDSLIGSIITVAPAVLDYCEFDCRAPVCNDWANCPERLADTLTCA